MVALLDMAGAASIMPIIAILSNPNLVYSNQLLKYFFELFYLENTNSFLFLLCFVSLFLLLGSLSLKALLAYLQVNFVLKEEYYIGKRLAKIYLFRPYTWFINQHSSELSKNILSEVGNVVSNALIPLISLYTNVLVIIFMFSLLIIVNLKLTIIVAIVLCASYMILYLLSRKFLEKLGSERLFSNEQRFKTITDAFGSPKEVKFYNLENSFLKKFSQHAYAFAHSHALSQVIGNTPRYGLEAIGFGGLLLILLTLVGTKSDFNNHLPIIAVFAYAGYRILPALQQIFSALVRLKFSTSAIDPIYNEFCDIFVEEDQELQLKEFEFTKKISFENIIFKYEKSSRVVLKDLNLKIFKGQKLGFVGETGCGKSTIIDIMLGLLKPNTGKLKIDDVSVKSENCRAWQKLIGYVPQHIFLLDASIAENIAFGVDFNQIDFSEVERVSKIVSIHDFVMDNLSEGYFTVVGERGVKLSGGQKQRIGLARALYRKPKIVVLDEATSALDLKTEKKVTKAINNLSDDLTIISVAHRLSSLQYTDIIYKVIEGNVVLLQKKKN